MTPKSHMLSVSDPSSRCIAGTDCLLGENGWNSDSTFASQIKVGSQRPILTLEEIEHHLEDVKCEDGKMKLHFVDTSSTRDARAACHGDAGGLIITSHESCNEDGERAVYQ